MNIYLQDVHVTLVISPTDLRCGYQRLHSIAQEQLRVAEERAEKERINAEKAQRTAEIK